MYHIDLFMIYLIYLNLWRNICITAFGSHAPTNLGHDAEQLWHVQFALGDKHLLHQPLQHLRAPTLRVARERDGCVRAPVARREWY
jgi:hypothetical protein